MSGAVIFGASHLNLPSPYGAVIFGETKCDSTVLMPLGS